MRNVEWTRDFVGPLGDRARYRLAFIREGQEIKDFLLQLEADVDGKWRPVLRYDTAHGKLHRDAYRFLKRRFGRRRTAKRTGPVDTTYDPDVGYKETMSTEQNNIRDQWEYFVTRFEDGEWPNGS